MRSLPPVSCLHRRSDCRNLYNLQSSNTSTPFFSANTQFLSRMLALVDPKKMPNELHVRTWPSSQKSKHHQKVSRLIGGFRVRFSQSEHRFSYSNKSGSRLAIRNGRNNNAANADQVLLRPLRQFYRFHSPHSRFLARSRFLSRPMTTNRFQQTFAFKN